MVTVIPPPVLEVFGLTADTVGAAAATYVNWSLDDVADLREYVVTVTSTTPGPWGGATTVSCVGLVDWILAAVVPNATKYVPVKLLPVIVTVEPPTALPEAGLTPVTAGAGAAVYVN
jgi:hypothetical protein